MDSLFLQTALRELKAFTGSPRFWLTFTAVVLLFAITGPYGTSQMMAFGPRLGYWFVIQAATWSIAVGCIILSDVWLMKTVRSFHMRILIGAALSSIPIGIAVEYITSSWLKTSPDLTSIGQQIIGSLPLTLVFALITFMTMSVPLRKAEGFLTSDTIPATTGPDTGGEPSPDALVVTSQISKISQNSIPLLERLKPENRGPLLQMSVEDHYVDVTTTRGHELILLRFSDALKETGSADGIQVHRSHWIARDHIEDFMRADGKNSIMTKAGKMIPVSRPYVDAVRTFLNSVQQK